LAAILISAVCVVLFVGLGGLTGLCGFAYPAFKSFQAIETKNKGDDTQWLVYWVIFALFSIVETFVGASFVIVEEPFCSTKSSLVAHLFYSSFHTDFVLYWIPFYYAFKLAFLLWCMLPQTRGAMFLYESFLRDFLKKNESKIDQAMAEAKKNAGTIASEIAGATSEIAGSVVSGSEAKKDS